MLPYSHWFLCVHQFCSGCPRRGIATTVILNSCGDRDLLSLTLFSALNGDMGIVFKIFGRVLLMCTTHGSFQRGGILIERIPVTPFQ